MSRTTWFLAASVSLALGCGPKRPPVVSTTAPGGAVAPTQETTSPAAETALPIDSGPDVQPLREDAMAGQEILGGASGEGGPLADVYFDFNQAVLSEAALLTLAKHAQWLKQHPDTKVTVEGHCDQRGTVEYNLALVAKGVEAARLTAISLGKERPLEAGSSESAWAKNRRAHFVVSR